MNCREWESQLDDFLSGRLSAERRQQAEEHLASCPACSELYATAQSVRETLVGPEQTDLTEAILARTSGPACGRAEEQLCALIHEQLDHTDTQLVRAHLEHCEKCAALAGTLTWLLPLLPRMAEVDPGPAFTSGVLAATRRLGTRAGERRPTWRDRLHAWWQDVRTRPQFALEAAYAGTLLLILLFGTPVSPFKDTPPRALEVVQAGPSSVASVFVTESSSVSQAVKVGGERAWKVTGGQVEKATRDLTSSLGARWEWSTSARANLGRHSKELSDALLHIDLARSALHLKELGKDIQQLWRDWRGADLEKAPTGTNASADGGKALATFIAISKA